MISLPDVLPGLAAGECTLCGFVGSWGLYFRPLEMEFMVNAGQPGNVRAPRPLDGDNTDSMKRATTVSVECAQPVGAGQERKLAGRLRCCSGPCCALPGVGPALAPRVARRWGNVSPFRVGWRCVEGFPDWM
jgi:hypothetical protein